MYICTYRTSALLLRPLFTMDVGELYSSGVVFFPSFVPFVCGCLCIFALLRFFLYGEGAGVVTGPFVFYFCFHLFVFVRFVL